MAGTSGRRGIGEKRYGQRRGAQPFLGGVVKRGHFDAPDPQLAALTHYPETPWGGCIHAPIMEQGRHYSTPQECSTGFAPDEE
jgi:hypothetical protein